MFRKLANSHARIQSPWFEAAAVKGKWFEVYDLNNSASDAPRFPVKK
jgi:hypothetical protein